MAYLLSNICTKNYWNWTTVVEIIVGGCVVSFFWDSVESGAVMNSGDSLKTIVATPDLIKEMVYAASVPDSVPVAD